MMQPWRMRCLDDETVFAFVEGRLPRDEVRAVDEHIAGCADCRRIVAEALKAVGPPATAIGGLRVLAPGTHMARYIVERVLGSGGAGVVYEAFDPELRRKVAVKLLRPSGDAEATGGRS